MGTSNLKQYLSIIQNRILSVHLITSTVHSCWTNFKVLPFEDNRTSHYFNFPESTFTAHLVMEADLLDCHSLITFYINTGEYQSIRSISNGLQLCKPGTDVESFTKMSIDPQRLTFGLNSCHYELLHNLETEFNILKDNILIVVGIRGKKIPCGFVILLPSSNTGAHGNSTLEINAISLWTADLVMMWLC